MAGKFDRLNKQFAAFIRAQRMFFVATADREGRVNVSPKGMDSLRILADDRIVWLSLTGSGNETACHLRHHNRITMMFCAFEGEALILRVYGCAAVIHPRDNDWSKLEKLFPPMAGARQLIDVRIEQVQTSCGAGVPVYDFRCERGPDELLPFYAEMNAQQLNDFWQRKNLTSIDGKSTGIFEQ